MKEQIMVDEVLRYLNDDTYDYALMIDGAYGCGKTHFIVQTLSDNLDKIKKDGESDRVRYYSACSCDSVGLLRDTVAYDFIKTMVSEIPDDINKDIEEKEIKEKSTEEAEEAEDFDNKLRRDLSKKSREFVQTVGEHIRGREEQIKKSAVYSVGLNIGGKVLKGLIKSKTPGIDSFDAISCLAGIKDISDYIFIFDDIERCSYSVHDLFCFITELVEQAHAKVIVVINEEALKRKKEQYYSYLEIKEKLIGCSLQYIPDYISIFRSILDKTVEEDSVLYQSVLENLESFKSQMKEKKHYSMRTFLFFLSRMKYLEERIVKECGNISDEKLKKIFSVMVPECFTMCLNYKDLQYRENKTDSTELPDDYHFKSVNRYVCRGLLNIEELVEKEIQSLLQRK